MNMRYLWSLFILLPVFLAGCFSDPAYVLHANEFNRESPDYAQEPEDISSVTVCYNTRGTTPQEVQKLAKDECDKFKKVLVFNKQDYAQCPIATPISANFSCVAPGDLGKNKKSHKTVVEKNIIGKNANVSGGPFYYSP